MDGNRYVFTRAQLDRLLTETVEMFIEYRDKHGKDEEDAITRAVSETMDGLSADRELFTMDGVPLALQLEA
jgi:hypothetical protein